MPQNAAAFVSLAGEGNTYGTWPLVLWGSQAQKSMMLPQPMVPTANLEGSFLPLAGKAKTLFCRPAGKHRTQPCVQEKVGFQEVYLAR